MFQKLNFSVNKKSHLQVMLTGRKCASTSDITKLFCTWNFLPTHHKYLKHANAFIGVDKYWLSSLAGQMRLRVFPESIPQLAGWRHSSSSLGMPAGRGLSSLNPACFWSGATDPRRKTSIAFQGFLMGWAAASRRPRHLLDGFFSLEVFLSPKL